MFTLGSQAKAYVSNKNCPTNAFWPITKEVKSSAPLIILKGQLSIGMQTFFWSIEFASFSWLLLKSFWHSGGKKIWRVKCHSNLLSFLLLCRYDWLWVKSIWRESVIGLFIHFYLELFFTWWCWSLFFFIFLDQL